MAGKSSGGFGALWLYLSRSNVFGAVASHSGDMAFDLCYLPDLPKVARAVEKAGGLEPWWQAFQQKPKRDHTDMEVLNLVATSAAYSPDPDAPLGVELPVDLATLELREPVWRRWLSFDPVELLSGAEAGRHAEALGKLSLLSLRVGPAAGWRLSGLAWG